MIRFLLDMIKSIAQKIVKNRWIFRLIGIILFIVVLRRIDLKASLQTLIAVDLRFVFLSLVFQGLALVFANLRWQLIMRRLEIIIPFSRGLVYQLIGASLALVTPGQLGEFIKALYLRRDGFPAPQALLSVAIDRIFDLLMLLLFGFISVTILFGLLPNLVVILAVTASLSLLVGIVFFRYKEKTIELIVKAVTRMSPKAYKEDVNRDIQRLTNRIGEFDFKLISACILLTIGNYFFLIFRVYAIVLSLHLNVPFFYYMIIVPILRLVGLVPITVLGIGTRDVTSIYLLGRIGIPASEAVLVSVLGLFTLQVQILIGLVLWWRHPLESKRESIPPLPENTPQD